MQDDVVALFAYDRWANRKILCVVCPSAGLVASPSPVATADR